MKNYEFTGKGKILYDPPRPGMKRKNQWWCICTVDREVTRYYRWWIKNRYGIELDQPAWNAHISIIRGEEPSADLKYLWKKYHGQIVEFNYSHYVRQAGDTLSVGKRNNFWFVDATAPLFTRIRDELNLKSNWKQHITIGKTHYEVPDITKYEDR